MKTPIVRLTLVVVLAAGAAVTSSAQSPPEPVYTPGPGVTAPVAVKQLKPAYTSTAMRAGIQGPVTLECIVTAKGVVGEAKVVRSLDPGLDAQAIKAVKQWRFTPGKKDGRAVAVKVSVEMTFVLRQEPDHSA